MKNIFSRGDFRNYRMDSLNKSRAPILEHSQFAERQTTVFISHKHDDLDNLKILFDFLKSNIM